MHCPKLLRFWRWNNSLKISRDVGYSSLFYPHSVNFTLQLPRTGHRWGGDLLPPCFVQGGPSAVFCLESGTEEFCTQSACAAGCLKPRHLPDCIPSSAGRQCREVSPSPLQSSEIWGKSTNPCLLQVINENWRAWQDCCLLVAILLCLQEHMGALGAGSPGSLDSPRTSNVGTWGGSLDMEGKSWKQIRPSFCLHRHMCLWLPRCSCLKMHVTKLLCICKEGVVGNNEHAIGLEIDLSGFKDYCLLRDGTHITISQFSYDIINLLCKDFIARLVHLSKIRETQNPIRKLTFQAGLAFT